MLVITKLKKLILVHLLIYLVPKNKINLSKYLKGIYEKERIFEDIKTSKENDLMLGFRLIEGIDIDVFNKKYNDDLLNRDIIKELINDKYLEVVNNHLRCNSKYLYLENYFLEKIIDSEL